MPYYLLWVRRLEPTWLPQTSIHTCKIHIMFSVSRNVYSYFVCMYIFCTVQMFLWCLVTALTLNVLHCLVQYVSCQGILHDCWVYSPHGSTFWTMILGKWPTWSTILFYVFIFNSLHVSSTTCSSSGETDCVNTTSGSCHSVLVAVLCAGRKWTSGLHVTWPHRQLPEVVLIQFVSPDDEHDVLKTCRELKIKINT